MDTSMNTSLINDIVSERRHLESLKGCAVWVIDTQVKRNSKLGIWDVADGPVLVTIFSLSTLDGSYSVPKILQIVKF